MLGDAGSGQQGLTRVMNLIYCSVCQFGMLWTCGGRNTMDGKNATRVSVRCRLGSASGLRRLYRAAVTAWAFAAGAAMAEPVLVPLGEGIRIEYRQARAEDAPGVVDAVASIANASPKTVYAPLRLVVGKVSGGLRLANPSGRMRDGQSYVAVPLATEGFPPGAQVEVPLRLVPGSRQGKRDAGLPLRIDSQVFGQPVLLRAPIASPGAIVAGSKTRVDFTLYSFGMRGGTLRLKSSRPGGGAVLNDDGRDGDHTAGDGIFGGSVDIDARGMARGNCIRFRAELETRGAKLLSPDSRLCVTGFPIGLGRGDGKGGLIPHPDGAGAQAFADQVVVGFREGITERQIENIAAVVGAKVVGTLPRLGVFQFAFPAPLRQDAFAAMLRKLRALPAVRYAEPNGPAQLSGQPQAVPNDPQFASQWHLAKIGAPEAWRVIKSIDVVPIPVVAVVDSGIDFVHPDIPPALPALPSVCVGLTCNLSPNTNDSAGHGTHVAGIIAAKPNNGPSGPNDSFGNPTNFGTTGVSWGANLRSVRITNNVGAVLSTLDGGNGYLDIITGIDSAVALGVRVVNASLGWPVGGCGPLGSFPVNTTLLVAAAGNDGNTAPSYPATCAGVLGVANTQLDDTRHSTSNYGSSAKLAAPGTGIFSTVLVGTSCVAPPGDSQTYCDVSGYKAATGTSMAAPVVSGAAALMYAQNPSGMTPADMIAKFQDTGVPVTGLPALRRLDLCAALLFGPITPLRFDQTVSIPDNTPVGNVVAEIVPACDNASYVLKDPSGNPSGMFEWTAITDPDTAVPSPYLRIKTKGTLSAGTYGITLTAKLTRDPTVNVSKSLTIEVVAVNDAPILSGANNLTSINEDPATNNGTLVSALIAGKVSDADAGALSGIAVTAVSNSNGAWQYTTSGGGTWSPFGTPSATSARLLAADANTLVRFVPDANWNGSLAGGITFRAWDQTSGSAGNTADTSTNGGTSAYSAATASAGITVSAVNDPPTLTVPAAFVVPINAAGNLVYGATPFTDVDSPTLTVTLSVADGTISASSSGGVSVGGTAVARSFDGTVAALNSFFSTAGNISYQGALNNSAPRTLTTMVSDGGPPVSADSTVNFSANHPPTLATPPAASYVDTAADDSFTPATGTLLGADVDAGATLTYGIVGGTVAAGTSSGTGAYGTLAVNTATGAYTFTPNRSAIQARKTNASESHTVSVSDGLAPPVTATFTVNITGADDPTLFGGQLGGAVSEDGTLTASGTLSASDRDTGDAAIMAQSNVSGIYGVFNIAGNGAWSYSLNNAAANVQALAAGQSVTDSFTVATAGGATQAITITIAGANDPYSGVPGITGLGADGLAHVGQPLAAVISGISDADCPTGIGSPPCVSSYQWKHYVDVNGVPNSPIAGATSSQYLPVMNDVGTQIYVCVSYTDAGGNASPEICNVNDAVTVGDPHITTVDGLHYDFQSAGEFVALRDADGMEIQVRHTPVATASSLTDPYSGLTTGVGINTAVAARVGSRRVTFQPGTGANPASSGLELRVDGQLKSLPATGLDLGNGGRVVPSPGGGIRIDFPNMSTLIATPAWWNTYGVWYLNVNVFHTSAHEGIMGARANGSWLPRLADGSALGPMPVWLDDRYTDLYVKFAESWRVQPPSSLFDPAAGSSTPTVDPAEWPGRKPPFLVPGSDVVVKPGLPRVAERACRALVRKNDKADCLFDVMVTGHGGFARTHLLSQKLVIGSTAIIVRRQQAASNPGERVVTIIATVMRDSSVPLSAFGLKGVPTGRVKFTIDGAARWRPVKLDKKGQAKLRVSRDEIKGHRLGALFIPAAGSPYMPSRSVDSAGSGPAGGVTQERPR